ncbi:MAG TPA: metallophosphoesterase [Deltaproteobacteria bacterium]|jgi:Icc-related predicted phosphoesterase|nr:metallophosphoesterase [Deltaproteobacteria bacterium]HOI06192.1 metallophosphoesterase [Deltaproteobacteria bacterium]
MRILFTSDLHGRKDLYEQMASYAQEQDARCVIIGGDLLPTRVNPYRLLTGGFPFERALHDQMEFIDSFLAPFFERFAADHPDRRVFYIPGNHDWEKACAHLARSATGAASLQGKKTAVDGVTLTGYGCVTDSPFWVKDYVRLDTRGSGFIRSRYSYVSTDDGIRESDEGAYALGRPSMEEELAGFTLEEPEKSICVFHSPPHGTGIDTLHNGRPIGSRAITGFILRHRPLVSLHGHIHEAPYMTGFYHTMIGPTLAVNPGHHPRELHAVVFDTDDPAGTLSHRIFGRMPVARTRVDRVRDRFARTIKGYFMKKVLTR